MNWYHLSHSNTLEGIVRTDCAAAPSLLRPSVPQWIKDAPPNAPYMEPDHPPRVSVAPKVWQCAAGLGRDTGNPTGLIFVYEVLTTIVIKRPFNNVETVITDEQWITDEIIDDRIDIQLIACIQIENIFSELKNFTIAKSIDQMKMLDEWEYIWCGNNVIDGLRELELNIDRLREKLKY